MRHPAYYGWSVILFALTRYEERLKAERLEALQQEREVAEKRRLYVAYMWCLEV